MLALSHLWTAEVEIYKPLIKWSKYSASYAGLFKIVKTVCRIWQKLARFPGAMLVLFGQACQTCEKICQFGWMWLNQKASDSRIKHVPLQRHFWLFKVCRSITGAPTVAKVCEAEVLRLLLIWGVQYRKTKNLILFSGSLTESAFKKLEVFWASYSLPVFLIY